MSLIRELEEFARSHRPCGQMTADASRPSPEGYLLSVECECGASFERWVAPEVADAELLWTDVLASPN